MLAGVKQRKREWELTSERLSEIRCLILRKISGKGK